MLPILNSAFDKTYNYCCLQCRKRIFPINHFFVHELCSIFYEFLPVSKRSIGNKAITYVTRDFHGRNLDQVVLRIIVISYCGLLEGRKIVFIFAHFPLQLYFCADTAIVRKEGWVRNGKSDCWTRRAKISAINSAYTLTKIPRVYFLDQQRSWGLLTMNVMNQQLI